jgi:hypothetical protein
MEWEMGLSEHKEKVNLMKEELVSLVATRKSHDDLMKIEHFQNQFHIQLINIHDIEHAVKKHMEEADRHSDYRFKEPHQKLKMKFESLVRDLSDLEKEFKLFRA